MVRSHSKPKKPRGDDAFAKQKQKTGRKKLAPVTDTRAEVHARSLYISTSSALHHASTSDDSSSPAHRSAAVHPKGSGSVKELLKTTTHYKGAQRAAAYSALARLLVQGGSSLASPEGTPSFYVPMATQPAEGGDAPSAVWVEPLDKLRAFTAALEAMTDTELTVRQAALSVLQALFAEGWMCPARSGGAAASPTRGSASRIRSAAARKRRRAEGERHNAKQHSEDEDEEDRNENQSDTDDDNEQDSFSSAFMWTSVMSAVRKRDRQRNQYETNHTNSNSNGSHNSQKASLLSTAPVAEALSRLYSRPAPQVCAKLQAAGRCWSELLQPDSRGIVRSDAAVEASRAAQAVALENITAVVHTIYVCLTHAMHAVRWTGIELLESLFLYLQLQQQQDQEEEEEPMRGNSGAATSVTMDFFRDACRQVAKRQQQMERGSEVFTAVESQTLGGKPPASDVLPTPAAALTYQQQQSQEALLEEQWMMQFVQRVSQLVLRTPHLPVLAALVEALLFRASFTVPGRGVQVHAPPTTRSSSLSSGYRSRPTGDAAQTSEPEEDEEGENPADLLGALWLQHRMASNPSPSTTSSSASSPAFSCPAALRALWQGGALRRGGISLARDVAGVEEWEHLHVVCEALESTLLSPWSNTWKELMEKRLDLLRHEVALSRAVALARTVAAVMAFLQVRRQRAAECRHNTTALSPSSSALNNNPRRFAKKANEAAQALQDTLLDLFIYRVPLTLETLLMQAPPNPSAARRQANHRHTPEKVKSSESESEEEQACSSEAEAEVAPGRSRPRQRPLSATQLRHRFALAHALAMVAAPLATAVTHHPSAAAVAKEEGMLAGEGYGNTTGLKKTNPDTAGSPWRKGGAGPQQLSGTEAAWKLLQQYFTLLFSTPSSSSPPPPFQQSRVEGTKEGDGGPQTSVSVPAQLIAPPPLEALATAMEVLLLVLYLHQPPLSPPSQDELHQMYADKKKENSIATTPAAAEREQQQGEQQRVRLDRHHAELLQAYERRVAQHRRITQRSLRFVPMALQALMRVLKTHSSSCKCYEDGTAAETTAGPSSSPNAFDMILRAQVDPCLSTARKTSSEDVLLLSLVLHLRQLLVALLHSNGRVTVRRLLTRALRSASCHRTLTEKTTASEREPRIRATALEVSHGVSSSSFSFLQSEEEEEATKCPPPPSPSSYSRHGTFPSGDMEVLHAQVEVWTSLPRLLFALRLQPQQQPPLEREKSDNNGNGALNAGTSSVSTRAPQTTALRLYGPAPRHAACMDLLVLGLLHLLWSTVRHRDPLLACPAEAASGGRPIGPSSVHALCANVFHLPAPQRGEEGRTCATALSHALASLKGVPSPTGAVVHGVLWRCSPVTQRLAASIDFYLQLWTDSRHANPDSSLPGEDAVGSRRRSGSGMEVETELCQRLLEHLHDVTSFARHAPLPS